MTEEERLREQGRMLEERREIKTQLACLSNKTRRMEVALERLTTAVRQSHVLNWSVDPESGALTLAPSNHERERSGNLGPLVSPTLEEVVEFLVERKALGDRLKELERLLEI